jgi:hypothetical protein
MEDSPGLDASRKDGAGAPHHAVAAEMLGVESWVIDGVIDPDGRWWQTARRLGVDDEPLIERASPQPRALGLGRLV